MARSISLTEQMPLMNPTSQDGAGKALGIKRGLVVVISIGLLISIQGQLCWNPLLKHFADTRVMIATNMSMMTTAQSNVAADLDAFSESSWFTSAYMIHRPIFWAQAPVVLLLGLLLYLAIPKPSSDNIEPFKTRRLIRGLKRVAYAGAITLVQCQIDCHGLVSSIQTLNS
ncbi:major facilitator superfamily domain-containing protein [Penicillium sp. IBT 31633x]|nr:major facilitator superfamily domain-containing protein [Penicillium sp. IBT 31633x]